MAPDVAVGKAGAMERVAAAAPDGAARPMDHHLHDDDCPSLNLTGRQDFVPVAQVVWCAALPEHPATDLLVQAAPGALQIPTQQTLAASVDAEEQVRLREVLRLLWPCPVWQAQGICLPRRTLRHCAPNQRFQQNCRKNPPHVTNLMEW